MRISAGQAAKLAWRSSKGRHFGPEPDALGVATRLAAGQLREAGIVLEPLLRGAGLSVSQINRKDMRIGVASQHVSRACGPSIEGSIAWIERSRWRGS